MNEPQVTRKQHKQKTEWQKALIKTQPIISMHNNNNKITEHNNGKAILQQTTKQSARVGFEIGDI